MSVNDTRRFERYSIYKNEPIDKLVVNRPLQRIYEDINKLSATSGIHLESATDLKYGTVQYSSASGFVYDSESVIPSTSADYYCNIMTSNVSDDFSHSITERTSGSTELTVLDEGEFISDATYYMRLKSHDIEFVSMPNGVSCIIGTMEVGLNNILATFGTDNEPLTGNISCGNSLTGYSSYVILDDSDLNIIDNYAKEYSNDNSSEIEKIQRLKNLNGRQIPIEYPNEYSTSIRNNICHWTTYSSYNQSFVEIHLSSKIDVNKLYELISSNTTGNKYGADSFYKSESDSLHKETYKGNTVVKRPHIVFTQKPLVLMQIGFYTNDGVAKPVIGKDERIDVTKPTPEVEFLEHNAVGMQKLTNNEINDTLSPVVGFATVKDIETIYDENVGTTNTIVYFDIALKFLVGSSADPKMIYGMRSLNTRAKVQFTIMGV